ncbi:hypothetical protein ACIHFE_32950 [Streptomyces sp. NPDC052396]|uniref:hypothetical protein n=1 Tax=Streptomyces sp. NPDC052396 TaxID=3365689 RepID=UPI0037D02B8B
MRLHLPQRRRRSRPQATISGRSAWARPVAQDWVEQRHRSTESDDEQGVDHTSLERVLNGLDIVLQGKVSEHMSGCQDPNVFIPGLSEAAWWDNDLFPWLSDVEAAMEDITAEFESLGGLVGKRIVANPTELADEGRWSAHYLYHSAKSYPRNLNACRKP